MLVAAGSSPMTTEEFLALPDDGVERWLIEGEYWRRYIRVARSPTTASSAG